MAAHLLRKTSRKAILVLRPCRAHTLHTLTYRSMSRGGRVPYRGCQVQSHPCLNLARSDVLRWFVTRPLQIRSIPRWCCRARFSQPLPNYWSCSRGELFFAVFLFFPTELTSPYLLSPGSLCYLKTDLNGQWTCKLRRKFYTCHFLKMFCKSWGHLTWIPLSQCHMNNFDAISIIIKHRQPNPWM